MLATYN